MSPGHLYKSLRPEGQNKPGGRVGGALCGPKLEKRESCVNPFTSLPLACSNTSGFCEEGTHVEKVLVQFANGTPLRGLLWGKGAMLEAPQTAAPSRNSLILSLGPQTPKPAFPRTLIPLPPRN